MASGPLAAGSQCLDLAKFCFDVASLDIFSTLGHHLFASLLLGDTCGSKSVKTEMHK